MGVVCLFETIFRELIGEPLVRTAERQAISTHPEQQINMAGIPCVLEEEEELGNAGNSGLR
jgi:hypothetical protein